jgi:threonine dehydratase
MASPAGPELFLQPVMPGENTMATQALKIEKTIVAVFVSAGVGSGAGGFVIVGGKLKKVPSNNPFGKRLVAAAQAASMPVAALARAGEAEMVSAAEGLAQQFG